jgi:hypothetical protein
MARRFDRGEFREPQKTPEGFLRADAYVTRAGVFVYRDAQGSTRRELRHPDDVFAPESLATLSMRPLTLEHPEGIVTAENARDLSVGHVGDAPAREDIYVRTPVLVLDAAAVKAVVEGTHRETSCGYTCDIEEGAGTYDGEPYDCRQRNIRYNHVALVQKGRAGPEVRVRLDADSMAQVEVSSMARGANGGNVALTKVRKDGVTIELEEGQAQALTMLLEKLETAAGQSAQQLADMKGKLAEAQQGAETAKGEADAAKAKADSLEKELKAANDPARVDGLVRARVSLETKARKVLGDGVKLDGLTDRQVKTQVLEKLAPGVKFDSATGAYLDGRFDAAIDLAGSAALADVRQAADGKAGDAKKDSADPEAARGRMIERLDKRDTK